MENIDITNTFIHTDVGYEFITMKIRGNISEMMTKISLEMYHKYITIDAKENSVLYICMLEDVYGTMKATLLFYLKLAKDLKSKVSILTITTLSFEDTI